jgi:putative ABC transport system permease protein
VKVRDLNTIEEVTQSIEKSLNRREDVVNVLETKKVLETILTAFSSISMFVTAIGGISLIVAGVSIFNIMMMSVTERIREIGIMRSIGTQKRDVLKMFLYEALILGLIGSLIGGVLAFAAGYAVSSLLLNSTKYIFLPSSLVQVVYGMVFGIGTSLICGIYPAWKGSNLNPIEALRHE